METIVTIIELIPIVILLILCGICVYLYSLEIIKKIKKEGWAMNIILWTVGLLIIVVLIIGYLAEPLW